MAGRFVRHLVRGQASQFFINQRQQLIGGSGIAWLSRFKNTHDIAHAARVARQPRARKRNDRWTDRHEVHELSRIRLAKNCGKQVQAEVVENAPTLEDSVEPLINVKHRTSTGLGTILAARLDWP